MLRRPPTAITLSNEDILKFDESRKRKLAEKRAQAASQSSQDATKSVESQGGAEKSGNQTATDRIMGPGGGR
jgi:Anaphase-promoting complex APC subunit CDC26